MRKNLIFRRILALIVCICVIGISSLVVLNSIVKGTSSDQILSPDDLMNVDDFDCILVLGCFVKDNGMPSDMLHDRLKRGVELYELGASSRLLMSGDHGRTGYDEVAAMKRFAVDSGIPSEAVFMDHAGFSTYESVYRAKEIFQAKRILIVTQEYHLYRALYIANQMGLDAYGVPSDYHTYRGQHMRDIRELLARVKDVATCIFKPDPTYLGDVIPIFGDGNITNDNTVDFA